MRFRSFALVACLATSCGKKDEPPPPPKQDAGAARPTVAPLVMPVLGVDRPTRMAYRYNDAAEKEYGKALGAYNKKDWQGVRAGCEGTLARDPWHLDAHWLLATALAQLGEPAAAVEHVVIAVAADYHHFGVNLGTEDLKELMATTHGKAVAELAVRIAAEYARLTEAGMLVVARRSPYSFPRRDSQSSTPRGELYAYDLATRRYLRLTHTDHLVAGYVRSPSGGEVALLGFDRVDVPRSDDAAPLVARGWVQVVGTKDWKQLGPRATIGAAREIELGYGAGEQLLVATSVATGRWGTTERSVASVDKTAGKLVKGATELAGPRIVLAVDAAEIVRFPDDAKAAWAGDPPVAPSLEVAGDAIAIPESGQVTRSTVAVAPDKAHVAFATAVDPCAKGVAPSLYVADTKAKSFKHVLTAASRFDTRWLGAATLAYEDGDGAIRIWDAKTAREVQRLDNKAGIALDVLSLSPGPPCKAGAGPDTSTGSGSDEPTPTPTPGEGPVTSPN